MVSRKLEEGEYFYLCDGNCLTSLKEFFNSLPEMSEEVFTHHVNSEKNDFSNWILGVFKNAELSEKIKSVQTKKEMISLIVSYLEGVKKRRDKEVVIKIAPKTIRPVQITKEFALSKLKEGVRRNG